MAMMKIVDMLSNNEKLESLIEKEVKKVIDKGDLTPVEVDNLKKVVCLVKEIAELEKESMELDGYMDESSNGYYPNGMMPYSYNNPNRSAMTGRYTRGSSMNNRPGSYNNGRSGHSIKDRMVARLESMMDEAQSEYERQQVADMINQIQH